jgi:hypothetical protein
MVTSGRTARNLLFTQSVLIRLFKQYASRFALVVLVISHHALIGPRIVADGPSLSSPLT